ncbi:MAG: BlaI/MecI/CopY family transcriptional regulator [Bacteroidales bacterium]|nr:BlaI/MecI/CopY family transcriptional regulator [Bacteroidales bacterium]
MSKKSKKNPTETELEILQILWQYGPSTVKFINEKQNESKVVGYTTTLKIMQIMSKKGMLKVDKESRQHVYTPTISEKETQTKLLDRFLSVAFSGSATKLVLQALGDHNPSQEELAEIKKLIQDIENQSKDS